MESRIIQEQQPQSSEIPADAGKIQETRNDKGQYLPGVSGHPEGKIPGTRNFSTDFDEVTEEIAKLNKITKSEARKVLLKVAYMNAKDGNFNFWKDIHDRIYGKVPDSLKVQGSLVIQIEKELADKYNVKPSAEDNSSGQPQV